MPTPSPAAVNNALRPLDAMAAVIVVILCFSWGFTQVAVKLAITEIPPLTQGAIRSLGAGLVVYLWMRWRGQSLFERDGTLGPGLLCGICFGAEFTCIYYGLNYTTASRATLFIYLAPFFVVIAMRWLMPNDRFRLSQWVGLILSFAGMALAFGAPTPAVDPRQLLGDMLMVMAALFWMATTVLIKVSVMNRISAEKSMIYQLAVSGPMLALAAWIAGESLDLTRLPSATALAGLGYQTLYVVPITFVIWFALIVRYSASRLSAFTFLTPLFGVFAGHWVLGDPLTPAFAVAVVMVAIGLVLVNRRP